MTCASLNIELECLRESTKNALHQSWDEVELLNKKHTKQEERINSLSADLNESLTRENELKIALNKTQKELAKLKKKLKNDSLSNKNGRSSYLPRALSDEFLRNKFSLATISSSASSSYSAQPPQPNETFSLRRPGDNSRFAHSGKNIFLSDFDDNSSASSKRKGSLGGSSLGGASFSSSCVHLSDGYDCDRSQHSHLSSFMGMLGLSLSRHEQPPLGPNPFQDYNVSGHQDQLGGEEPQESRTHNRSGGVQNTTSGKSSSGESNICPLEFEDLKRKLSRREKDINLLEEELVQNTKNFQELLLSTMQKE